MFDSLKNIFFILFSGNVMNGPIGKQMVDTLVESSSNVEVLLLDNLINLFILMDFTIYIDTMIVDLSILY